MLDTIRKQCYCYDKLLLKLKSIYDECNNNCNKCSNPLDRFMDRNDIECLKNLL